MYVSHDLVRRVVESVTQTRRYNCLYCGKQQGVVQCRTRECVLQQVRRPVFALQQVMQFTFRTLALPPSILLALFI